MNGEAEDDQGNEGMAKEEKRGSTEGRAVDVVVVELVGELLEEGECCVEQEKRSGRSCKGCTSGLSDELEGEPTEERNLARS